MKRLLLGLVVAGLMGALSQSAIAHQQAAYVQGVASYYDCGPGQCGPTSTTASGERFNANAMTCAMPRLNLGAIVRLELLGRRGNVIGRSWCRVNDRGPYYGGRVLDMTPAVKRSLRMGDLGVVKVYIQKL